MTYVGATPTTGDFKKLDSITTSSTTTFNLRQGGVAVYPQSANHCIVSLNGVIQAPVDAFTIVNDTIVFASSLASSDVINFILVLGNVNDIGTPSDDTVSTAKIQNLAVSQAKIAGDAINADKIADDAISEEHLDVTAITGHPEKTSLVDADKFLISDSAASGALKYVQKSNLPSGGLQLVTSFTPSSEGSTIVVDNCFTSSYDRYLVYCERLRNGNDQATVTCYLREGGSSGSDSCNLGGAYLGYRYNNAYMSGSRTNSCEGVIASNVKQDTWYNVIINFVQPHDSAYTTNIQGQSVYKEGSTSHYGFINFGYQPSNTNSHTGFAIQLSSGNFNQTSSTIKVYGIVDS